MTDGRCSPDIAALADEIEKSDGIYLMHSTKEIPRGYQLGIRKTAEVVAALRSLDEAARTSEPSWRDSWGKLPRPGDWIICDECAGQGDIETVYPFPDDPYFCAVNKCEACNGKGGHLRDPVAPDAAQPSAGLIHPDVLMNVVQAKLNDYVELHNRGDLTELGEHAWLVVVNLQRDLEFALKASPISSTDGKAKP